MNPSQDGLVLLNKPTGITSFRALGRIKKILGTRKMGHTGTLDKFAEGLLIVLTGRYTRLSSRFIDLDKEYMAEIRFGIETDTLDPEGNIVRRGGIPLADTIVAALDSFKGQILQTPPRFSAVHCGGKRASFLARSGEDFKLLPRKVRIYGIELIEYRPPDLTVRIHCSRGTYIRSLARDLGRKAGTCAHVRNLKRIAVGAFRLADAVSPSEFNPTYDLKRSIDFITCLPGVKPVTVKPEFILWISNGNRLDESVFTAPPKRDGEYAVCTFQKELLAIVRRKSSTYSYLTVFKR